MKCISKEYEIDYSILFETLKMYECTWLMFYTKYGISQERLYSLYTNSNVTVNTLLRVLEIVNKIKGEDKLDFNQILTIKRKT